MKLKLQLIIESDSGETEVVQEVTKLERHSLRPENLGLMLSEAKELLQEVQRAMVTYQTTGYATQQIPCPKCGKIQSRKGKHQIVLRTLFGKLRLDSPRLLPLRMLQQERVPQLQSACRVTYGPNGARVGLPRKQVCSPDLLRLHRRCANRQAADQYHALLHNPHVSCYPNLGAPAMT